MNVNNSVDEYIAGFPAEVQEVLQKVRATIQEELPEAGEKISYGIPTFHQGKNLVHFAGYKRHIGFYPGASGIEHFQEEFEGYKFAKGSVQFPLDRPMPYDLIRRICRFRLQENQK